MYILLSFLNAWQTRQPSTLFVSSLSLPELTGTMLLSYLGQLANS